MKPLFYILIDIPYNRCAIKNLNADFFDKMSIDEKCKVKIESDLSWQN